MIMKQKIGEVGIHDYGTEECRIDMIRLDLSMEGPR